MATDRQATQRKAVDSIRRMMRALRISANQTHATLGISGAQLYLLRHLATHNGASLTELAAGTLTDRTSVTEVVDRLIHLGLAQRAVSAADRRRACVRITSRGRRVATASNPAPTDLLLAGLAKLKTAKLARLEAGLADLVAAMDIEETPPEMLFQAGQDTPERTPRSSKRKRDPDGVHG